MTKIICPAGGRPENAVAGAGGVGRSRGEEPGSEGDETVVGGDGHSAGGDMVVEVKVWRTSISCGLFAGSCFQHNSTISQMG